MYRTTAEQTAQVVNELLEEQEYSVIDKLFCKLGHCREENCCFVVATREFSIGSPFKGTYRRFRSFDEQEVYCICCKKSRASFSLSHKFIDRMLEKAHRINGVDGWEYLWSDGSELRDYYYPRLDRVVR